MLHSRLTHCYLETSKHGNTRCSRSEKVREKDIFSRSRNSVICQGILEFKQKSGKSRGILK